MFGDDHRYLHARARPPSLFALVLVLFYETKTNRHPRACDYVARAPQQAMESVRKRAKEKKEEERKGEIVRVRARTYHTKRLAISPTALKITDIHLIVTGLTAPLSKKKHQDDKFCCTCVGNAPAPLQQLGFFFIEIHDIFVVGNSRRSSRALAHLLGCDVQLSLVSFVRSAQGAQICAHPSSPSLASHIRILQLRSGVQGWNSSKQ